MPKKISTLLTVVSVLALAGCASIPSGGSVISGGAIGTDSGNSIEFLAAGPADGASALEIVQGFLEASKASQNNYQVARSFMTIDSGAIWEPTQETLVGDNFQFVEQQTSDGKSIKLSLNLNLEVDLVGHLEPVKNKTEQEIDFQLVKVDGEWRISVAPNQTILSSSDFVTTFGQYPVYYFAQDGQTLVPDVRVFANHNDLVSRIASAAMEVPEPLYFSNLYSMFQPDGGIAFTPGVSTGLTEPVTLRSATVTSGVANIEVSSNFLDASPRIRAHMSAAMSASLKGVQGIEQVKISTDGGIPSFDTSVKLTAEPAVDDRPLIINRNGFGYATSSKFEKIGALSDVVVKLEPSTVSLNSSGMAAVGSPQGVFLVEGGTAKKVSDAQSQISPQIGRNRDVWWVDPGKPEQLQLYSKGFVQAMPVDLGNTGRIVAAEISREGSRIALAVKQGQKTWVYVGSIASDEAGNPIDIFGFRQVSIESDSVEDLAWADSIHLAILGSQDGEQIVEYATFGGTSEVIGWSMSAVDIAGGNGGKTGIQLLLNNGELWSPFGTGWESNQIKADLLATQY